ncbi:MAG: hypothetical protein JWQ71_2199 [Pedosphaera sp.]|nr:hypothetical protein [Pedosphaera sp.]
MTIRRILTLAAILFCSSITSSFAQSGPPALPEPFFPLNRWAFDDTNWLTAWGEDAPLSSTNIDLVPSWNNNALQVDNATPAWLHYKLVESNNRTNLMLNNGTVRFWFKPNWSSTNLVGGTGPGDWGRLIDVGAWTSNASYGWWSLYLNPEGTSLFFSAQTNNGSQTTFLSAALSWDAATWHEIELTYCLTNTALYLDGTLATNGLGVTLWPGANALTNGFFIGSDLTGTAQAHGQFEDFATFNGPQRDATVIASEYALYASIANPPLFQPNDAGPPSPGGDGGDGGGSTNAPLGRTYTTNDFWLEILPLGTNAYNIDTNSITLILHGTLSGIVYQVLSTTNLTNPAWALEQSLLGSEITNFTTTTILMTGRPTLFFRAQAYTLDSDGNGLPDWWQLQNFGH